MKRLLFIALFVIKKPTGLGVYSIEMMKRIIPELVNKYQIDIICTDEASVRHYLPYESVRYITVNSGNPLSRQIYMQRYYNKNKNKYDLIYSFTHHGMMRVEQPQIISVFDLIPVYYPAGRLYQYVYYNTFLRWIIKDSKLVITSSLSAEKDVKDYFKVDYVHSIYDGVTKPEKTNVPSVEELSLKNDYVIIGIHFSYKNIHTVIKIFAKDKRFFDRRLYIIGNNENKYGRYLKKLATKLKVADRVIFTGFITKEEKERIISQVRALIYPTKYEGFGLPALEGMAMGIPVVCSNTSSLPEVVKDAALLFDPCDINDIADKILEFDDLSLQKEYIRRGYKNIERFSWDDSAKEIVDIIEGYLKMS